MKSIVGNLGENFRGPLTFHEERNNYWNKKLEWVEWINAIIIQNNNETDLENQEIFWGEFKMVMFKEGSNVYSIKETGFVLLFIFQTSMLP